MKKLTQLITILLILFNPLTLLADDDKGFYIELLHNGNNIRAGENKAENKASTETKGSSGPSVLIGYVIPLSEKVNLAPEIFIDYLHNSIILAQNSNVFKSLGSEYASRDVSISRKVFSYGIDAKLSYELTNSLSVNILAGYSILELRADFHTPLSDADFAAADVVLEGSGLVVGAGLKLNLSKKFALIAQYNVSDINFDRAEVQIQKNFATVTDESFSFKQDIEALQVLKVGLRISF